MSVSTPVSRYAFAERILGLGGSRVVLGLLAISLACAPAPAERAPDAKQGDAKQGDAKHGHGDAKHGHGDAKPNAGHHGGGHHKHHRFEDADEWAKQFDSPERAAWQKPDEVVASFSLAPDAAVADLGAGTGYFAERFARAAPRGQVYAQDIEPDMVRYLGERASKAGLENLKPVLGTADDPALPEAVDLAFMCDVYHHIADVEGYFKKVAVKLKPGGRLAIVDFKKDAPDDAPGPPAAMRVAADVIVEQLSGLGYQLERRDDALLEYQYVLVFTRAA